MIRKYWLINALLCIFALGSVAGAQTTVPDAIKVMKMGDMSMLTDAKGLTLYVFDADTDGKSTCNAACAQNWPPMPAASDAKPVAAYTIVTRNDGSMQWAYKGKPLYHYKNDKAPMDTNGDGVAGKWHVAKP